MARYADLDAATRRQVDAALGRTSAAGKTRKRARPSAAQGKDTGGSYTCECGEMFTTYAAAERHPSGPGHTRMTVQMSGMMSATGGSTSHS